MKNIKKLLTDEIKEIGVTDTANLVGGINDLFKILNINTPMDFLHLFDDLNQVQSEEKPDWTLFRYKPKYNLMIYNRKNDYVYINYREIWGFLEVHFGLKYSEIQELTKIWLGEVYNLRGITTTVFSVTIQPIVG